MESECEYLSISVLTSINCISNIFTQHDVSLVYSGKKKVFLVFFLVFHRHSLPILLQTIPRLPGSALRWSTAAIPGVDSPMLYIGMLYATFAWHVEDHFMYSVNYSHAGAPKIWYSVPASGADALEAAAAATVYAAPCTQMQQVQGVSSEICLAAVADALARKTTVLCPKVLQQYNVPVYRAVQEVGSYVVTFPRAYHAGFSIGFNLGNIGWFIEMRLLLKLLAAVVVVLFYIYSSFISLTFCLC